MRFNQNARLMTILQRTVLDPPVNGSARGPYQIAFQTNGDWRYMSGREMVEAGLAQDEATITVRVNDGARNRTISAADRLAIGNYASFEEMAGVMTYDVKTVAPPDRATGSITITATRRVG
ncbi:MAG: head-tail adaptor protein [Methylocystis sp.]